MDSKRLIPLKGSQLANQLMQWAADNDPAAINCLDMYDQDPTLTDEEIISAYNGTEGRQHIL